MKTLWYIRGAMGDMYAPLASIDSVLNVVGASREECKFVLDSVYLLEPEKYKWQNDALMGMIKRSGIEFSVLDPKDSSAGDVYISSEEQRRSWYPDNTMTFLRGLRTPTQEIIAQHAGKEGRVIIATIITEHTYTWVPGQDIGTRILHDYTKSLEYPPFHEHYAVCIHPRMKYGYETVDQYDVILRECARKGLKTCIIGDPSEGDYFKDPLIHDLRKVPFNRCMGLAASSDFFIGSNSVYACHRYYSNGGYAMIYSPWTIGDVGAVTHPKHMEDLRYMFCDSGNPEMVKQSIDLLGRLL